MFERKILIVSDAPEVADGWSHAFIQRGLAVDMAAPEVSAARRLAEDAYRLALIDINESRGDLEEICRSMRAGFENPILVFTYEYDERIHLGLYAAGVDETVSKPLGTQLLLAKVSAWLARSSAMYARDVAHEYAAFRLETADRALKTPDGRDVKLSNLECRLLVVLLVYRGRAVSMEALVTRVWGESDERAHGVLKRLMYRLRRKIELDPNEPQYLQTVDGVGYRISYVG